MIYIRNSGKILPIFAAALLFFIITGIITDRTASRSTETAISEISTGAVLIIDPGHGGADGGAVAADGTPESSVNLDIALKLHHMALLFGQESVLTRSNNELDYPPEADTVAEMKRWDQHTRLELINSLANPVLISIHQNKYPDPRPFGPQVLYGSAGYSEELGQYCHELLCANLSPDNRRLAMPSADNIFLIKNAQCTAILVECGFISNEEELRKLCDETYQKKIASILLASYLKFN